VKDFTRFRNAELLDSDKQNSVILHTGTLDDRKSERNKTEKNNTESIKKRMERIRAEIREEILECLEMNCRGGE